MAAVTSCENALFISSFAFVVALSVQLGIILYVLDHYRILSDELASASSNLLGGY